MKKLTVLSIISLCVCLFAFQVDYQMPFKQIKLSSKRYTGNPPTGKTGAPGEQNCAQCHGGSANSGVGKNTFVFPNETNTYVPGNRYTISLGINSTSNKNGFQIVALKNEDNTNVGTWQITDQTNTQINSSQTRTYVNHTANGTSLKEWSIDWTAPNMDEGDITFYLSTNQSNGMNNTGGDMIYLSSYTISSDGNSAVNSYAIFEKNLQVFQNSNTSLAVNIQTLEPAQLFVKLTNIKGQNIVLKQLGKTEIGQNNFLVNTGDIPSGIYVASIFVNNHIISKKINIE